MSPQERGPRKPNLLDLRRKPSLEGFGDPINFDGVWERVVRREDLTLDAAREILKDRRFAVLGLGIQGAAQGANLRDNDFSVIAWQRERYAKKDEKPTNWEKAIADKWKPGVTLFNESQLAHVMSRANFFQILLDDAGQVACWPQIRAGLKPGDVVQFSHGFGPVFHPWTHIYVPPFVDLSLNAPKGPGKGVRDHFEHGEGVNTSVTVGQDASGKALPLTLASGIGIGSGYLFSTSFEGEVFSDLTGERGVLMGSFKSLMDASYNILRSKGLSPREAARHTVEIITQTISKIIGEKGGDGMLRDLPKELVPAFLNGFQNAHNAVGHVYEELYETVANGSEAARVITENSKPDHKERLQAELAKVEGSEFERAATSLRKERQAESPELRVQTVPDKIINKEDAIIAGALIGIMHAQYELFIRKGHTPSEAFNETVEEATQSLYPLVDDNGIAWLYVNCSTTARRGALDWAPKFRKVLEPALKPLYEGESAYRNVDPNLVLTAGIWKTGIPTRDLRPEKHKIA